jgi:ParB family transcriptional regulator, chromosome partitioning protein
MSRKDSKGMFAAVLGQLGNEGAPEVTAAPRSPSPHLRNVAASVRLIQERSEQADKLLKEGEQLVEFDPDSVLPSMIHDRFDGAYEDAAILDIVESMRERGQIVPGLVRPSPTTPGAFQIVYGRRRLAAAKQLGIKFRAVVRELSDEQAVIFQGEENTARDDLSFIEKCLFAVAQQEAGFKRETICASLSTGKSHVSEMIKIGTSIDKEIFHAIGSAPGIGRGRWLEFADRYAVKGSPAKAHDFTRKGKFLEATSDDRFAMLLSLLAQEPAQERKLSAAPEKPAAKTWAPDDNSVRVKLKDNGKTATIALGAANGIRFASFISGRLDDLYTEFRKTDETAQ